MEAQTSVVADDVQEFLAHRTFTVCEHTFLRARSHVLADSQTPLSSFMALSTHVGWEDPLEEGMATHSSILAWRIPMHRGAWQATVHGVTESQTERLSTEPITWGWPLPRCPSPIPSQLTHI